MKQTIIPIILAALLVGCSKPKPAVDIWTATATGNITAIKQNLETGIDINSKEPNGGGTPLMMAALMGQTEAADLLIAKGAKMDSKNNDGATALHLAAFFCHKETTQLLLDRGADATAKNNRGETPLAIVSAPWSPELQGIYSYIAGYLHLKIDIEMIKRVRPEMVDLLKKSGG